MNRSRMAASVQRAATQHPRAVRTRSREFVRVSVVIPTLNEAENLPFVLPRIPPEMEEIIVVDGHSTDGTCELALQLRPDAIVIRQDGVGKGAALRSGFAACTGDIIVMLDADGSTDPAEIPAFVGALLAGADFVKGSRFLQGGGTADMPYHRQLGNRAFVLLVRLFFGSRYSDLCYGYNAFWSDVVSRLNLDADGFEIETLMNIRALRVGLTVTEVASFEHRRRHGEGRLKIIPDGWRVLKTILSERFNRGAFDQWVHSGAFSRIHARHELLGHLESNLRWRSSPTVLVLFGFKRLTEHLDTLSEPEANVLLGRIAKRLSELTHLGGVIYEPRRGDFCGLFSGRREDIEHLLTEIASEIDREMQALRLETAFGVVSLPTEARDPVGALKLADQRRQQTAGNLRPETRRPAWATAHSQPPNA